MSIAGGLVIVVSSFGYQFRYRGFESALQGGGGCSAWSACVGEAVDAAPDITGLVGPLCVLGVAVAIVPAGIRLASGWLRSAWAGWIQLLGAWVVVLGVIAMLVVPTWQERHIGYKDENYEFVVLPGWGLAGLLVGAILVLVAAATARSIGKGPDEQ